MIEVEIRDQDPPLRILFSGDVGRYDGPLYHDPAPPSACDYLICESTYGNRDHPETDLLEALEGVVNRSIQRGGVMLMAGSADTQPQTEEEFAEFHKLFDVHRAISTAIEGLKILIENDLK